MPEDVGANPSVNDEQTQPAEQPKEDQPSGNPPSANLPTDQDPPSTESLLESGDPKEAQAEGAPEKYENFKGEDGVEFDAEQLKGFTDVARELGLSQEKAQKLFGAMMPTARDYLTQNLQAQTKEWAKATMSDPEVGGADFKAKQGVASAAYKQWATPELRNLLNSAGLGNHPEVVRLFYRIGKGMQQDSGVAGSASSPQNAPRRRYPKSNMVADMY